MSHWQTSLCTIQPIAGMASEADGFHRLIDEIFWITASEISSERFRQAFANTGLELMFLQSLHSRTIDKVEFSKSLHN